MSALPLFSALPKPPSLLERGIDLRCGDTAEMLASLPDGCADLVIADPPWLYRQSIGNTPASAVYACLPTPTIVEHVSATHRLAARLALWCTCPLLGEWMAAETPWGAPVTAGSWVRSGEGDTGHYGQGWHWAGSSELVLLYAKKLAHCDRTVPTRNGWVEAPREHSRKPTLWMVQWIRRWVPPGGLVVDLYSGLGTVSEATLLAGEGRRCVAAEIDPERHAHSLSLLAQVRT